MGITITFNQNENNITRELVYKKLGTATWDQLTIARFNPASTNLIIEDNAFDGCINLTDIPYAYRAKTVGKYAFRNCKSLRNVAFIYAKDIGVGAFKGCENLTNAELSKHMTTYPDDLFIDCYKLNQVINTDYVIMIGKNAFKNCKSLTQFRFNSTASDVIIDDHAFDNCTSLANVPFLYRVKYIGKYAFRNCPNLLENVYCMYATIIDDYAFQNCKASPILATNNNLTRIGNYAFDGCTNLSSDIVLNNCTEIGRYAFRGCENLSSLIAPKCTFVDYNAFYGTKLWNVEPV